MRRGKIARLGLLAVAVVAAGIAVPRAALAAPADKPIGQLVLNGGVATPVFEFSWAVTAASSWASGGGASIAKPEPSSIRFMTPIGANSIGVLVKIAVGQSLPTAVFTLNLGKPRDPSTMVYEMQGLLVTGVSHTSIDGRPFEEVSFVFRAVKWTHTDASGVVTTGSWDILSGSAS